MNRKELIAFFGHPQTVLAANLGIPKQRLQLEKRQRRYRPQQSNSCGRWLQCSRIFLLAPVTRNAPRREGY